MDAFDNLDDYVEMDGETLGDGFDDERKPKSSFEDKTTGGHIGADSGYKREDWAFATIAALAYVALVGAILVVGENVLSDFSRAYYGVALAVMGLLAYIVALQKDTAISRLFYTLGAVVFLLALTLSSRDAPTSFFEEGFWDKLPYAVGSVAEGWAVCVFLLATLLPSRALQFLVAFSTLVWFMNNDGVFALYVALIVCAVGEYWAWRRQSPFITWIYGGFCFFATLSSIVTEFALWRSYLNIALFLAPISLSVFYFSACLKNVFRAAGLLLGGVALCVLALPCYWDSSYGLDMIEARFSFAPYALSAVATLVFIFFCAHMIFSSSNNGKQRFFLGVSLALIWSIASTYMATRQYGGDYIAVVLCGVAFCFLLALIAEKTLMLLPIIRKKSRKPRELTSDGAEDERQFHDPLDTKIQESQNLPSGGLETGMDVVKEWLWKNFSRPALYAVMAFNCFLVLRTAFLE